MEGNSIVKLLCLATIVSGLLAAFRILSVIVFYDYYVPNQIQSYLSSFALFFVLAFWLGYYTDYRARNWMISKNAEQYINTNTRMKILSYIATFFCLARMLSVVLYYLHQGDMNLLTWVYVIMEVSLLIIMALLFYNFGQERAQRAKEETIKQNTSV